MSRIPVVAAALVAHGRVLAAHRRRPAGWEFPGGKVEVGESAEAAIERECLEELGVHVRALHRLGISRDERIELVLWLVLITAGVPVAGADHDELRWLAPADLAGLEWLPADRDLLPVVRAAIIEPMRFRATVELGGKTATGIEVPDDVIVALGSSKRPAVAVTINGYTYRTTAVRMGGRFLVPLSAENRVGAGVAAGDDVDVDIALDSAPREVPLPADLDAALDAALDGTARANYDALSYTHRKEWVRWIEEAKKPETRAARVANTVTALQEGKRSR